MTPNRYTKVVKKNNSSILNVLVLIKRFYFIYETIDSKNNIGKLSLNDIF